MTPHPAVRVTTARVRVWTNLNDQGWAALACNSKYGDSQRKNRPSSPKSKVLPDFISTPIAKTSGVVHFYTDGAGVYERYLPASAHTVGKANTPQIERNHLTLRTRIKRLARKTICFSKSVFLHDTVIGLFVNRYEFGTPI